VLARRTKAKAFGPTPPARSPPRKPSRSDLAAAHLAPAGPEQRRLPGRLRTPLALTGKTGLLWHARGLADFIEAALDPASPSEAVRRLGRLAARATAGDGRLGPRPPRRCRARCSLLTNEAEEQYRRRFDLRWLAAHNSPTEPGPEQPGGLTRRGGGLSAFQSRRREAPPRDPARRRLRPLRRAWAPRASPSGPGPTEATGGPMREPDGNVPGAERRRKTRSPGLVVEGDTNREARAKLSSAPATVRVPPAAHLAEARCASRLSLARGRSRRPNGNAVLPRPSLAAPCTWLVRRQCVLGQADVGI